MHLRHLIAPLFGLFLLETTGNPSKAQSATNQLLLQTSAGSTSQLSDLDTGEEELYSELTPAHQTAYALQPNSRTLQLLHCLPRFTTQAIVWIMDLSGRILKRIVLDPKDKGGSTITLNDLLEGNYHYVLILDSGRKIQGSFELKD